MRIHVLLLLILSSCAVEPTTVSKTFELRQLQTAQLTAEKAKDLGIIVELRSSKPDDIHKQLRIECPSSIDDSIFELADLAIYAGQEVITNFTLDARVAGDGKILMHRNLNTNIVTDVSITLFYGNSVSYELPLSLNAL